MRGGHNFIDLTGKKVNMLTVLERVKNSESGKTMWLCKCECGTERILPSYLLTKGVSFSCGCQRRKLKSVDITGFKNEYLEVLHLSGKKTTKSRSRHWVCKCAFCGEKFVANTSEIKSGAKKGCGCNHYKNVSSSLKTHGLSKTRIYSIWTGLKNRCFNKNELAYKNYGGRGITVCKEWSGKNGFMNFYHWAMENGYDDTLTIDRKDVNGNYEPSNCRWATYKEQVRNRRNTLKYTINGKEMTLKEWCDLYEIDYHLVYERIFTYGYSVEKALKKGRYNNG